MIKACITGGIGSGKTSITKIFKELGVPVFNSDKYSREAESDPIVQKEFKEILGEDIFMDGVLDRAKMRNLVFKDKLVLEKINSFMVPYIKEQFEMFCRSNLSAPYVILESAIIFETGSDKNFDYIITVVADVTTRMGRVRRRDGLSDEDIMNKMKSQLSDKYRLSNSHFSVNNDGDDLIDSLPHLDEQVLDIHASLCSLALKQNRL